MAAEHLKSTYITNATATPVVFTNGNLANGVLHEAAGTIAPAAAAEVNSTYRFCRVPSNARISQILWTSADFTTAGVVNVGVYQTADNGGAVVDADLFASLYDLSGGPFLNADITYESGEYTVVESEKMLWEVLGLSADSKRDYDIAATVTTQFNGGQTMHLKARFTV